jgi:hypothetical protein
MEIDSPNPFHPITQVGSPVVLPSLFGQLGHRSHVST